MKKLIPCMLSDPVTIFVVNKGYSIHLFLMHSLLSSKSKKNPSRLKQERINDPLLLVLVNEWKEGTSASHSITCLSVGKAAEGLNQK